MMKSPQIFIRMSLVLCLATLLGMLIGAQTGQQPEPSWKWPENRVFELVNKIRAGRDLTPKSWPQGARVAVGLSFDFDNETPSLRDGQTSPAWMAQGESGAKPAFPRILRLLDHYSSRRPSSFRR